VGALGVLGCKSITRSATDSEDYQQTVTYVTQTYSSYAQHLRNFSVENLQDVRLIHPQPETCIIIVSPTALSPITAVSDVSVDVCCMLDVYTVDNDHGHAVTVQVADLSHENFKSS